MYNSQSRLSRGTSKSSLEIIQVYHETLGDSMWCQLLHVIHIIWDKIERYWNREISIGAWPLDISMSRFFLQIVRWCCISSCYVLRIYKGKPNTTDEGSVTRIKSTSKISYQIKNCVCVTWLFGHNSCEQLDYHLYVGGKDLCFIQEISLVES